VEVIAAAAKPPQPPPPPPPPSRTVKARVLFDYSPPGPESMRLTQGDIIEVITRGDPGGWSIGSDGAFPTDYVEFIADTPGMAAAAVAAPSSSAPRMDDPFSGLDIPEPSTRAQESAPKPQVAVATAAVETKSESKQIKAATPVASVPASTKTSSDSSATPMGTHSVASGGAAESKPEPTKVPPPPKKREVASPTVVVRASEAPSLEVQSTAFADGEKATWRRFLFLDLFADYYVHQMASPTGNIKGAPALSRVMGSLKFVKQALSTLNLSMFPPATQETLVANVLVKASASLTESIDLSSKISTRSADPTKLFSFLATFTSRIRRLAVGEFLLFPVMWQSAVVTGPGEHAIFILMKRIARDTDMDYSVTVVNTSQSDGLSYHPMKADNSDASIKYNLTFTIPQVDTARAASTTFW
jgi:hypothetical protein